MGRKKNPIYDEAYGLYLSGLSLEAIAKRMGVSRQSVFCAFKKRGFVLRGPNFQPYQEYDKKKFTLKPSGYYALTTNKRTLMHRYVWEKERGKIPHGWDIHHVDGNKGNNKVQNLECLPKAEHTQKYSPNNNQHGQGKRPLEAIDNDGFVVKVFPNTTIAAKEMGVHNTAINAAINGKSKTSCGFRWRYASN